MKLTQFSNYALRTLQFAALRYPGRCRIEDISGAHKISNAHLLKVAHELGKRGYLETIRGRGGGVRLAKPPDQITVGEIVRFAEAPITLVECFSPQTNSCPLIGACRLSKAFYKALDAFLDVLDGVTIADIAANAGELNRRLSLTPDEPDQRDW